MNQQKTIKTALNSLSKVAGELYQAEFGKNVDDNKKIRSTFSHEK